MKLDMHEFIKSLQELEDARELLHKVWLDLGPYTDKVDCELWYKVNEYFKFDDSE